MNYASSRKPSLLKRATHRALHLLLGALLLVVAVVLLLRFVNPPTSAFMIAHQFGSSSRPLHHQWVNFDQISPWLPLAVMSSEDQKFPYHWGFDIQSIGKALEGYRRGGRLRGASTISQQTVKNLFLWSDQSIVRKGVEAGLTALVELLWPKRRIMEVYLNVAEFGEGIYGVEAASRHFFGISSSSVNARQAALLAAVLPNPKRFHVNVPSPYIWDRVNWIRQQMRQLGPNFVAEIDKR